MQSKRIKNRKPKLLWILWIIILLTIITIFGYILWLKSAAHKKPIQMNLSESWNVYVPELPFLKEKAFRSFTIDYQNDQFLKDEQSFQYISGSLHYFRVPRFYWRDRLQKYRNLGLNVVSTYVEWSTHEPTPNDYRFEGDQDLEYFLKLAEEEDLLVILRPGPYICAERDFGGLPPWLMSLYPNIELRTNNSEYQNAVKKWFEVLFPKLQKYLYGNGGPIIMVQIENEYGSYDACNMEYRIWLRDLVTAYVEDNAVLFTIDAANATNLECGTIPGVYPTIDFSRDSTPDMPLRQMRQFAPNGPLVDSEFYPGWISWWGRNMSKVDNQIILSNLKWMLLKSVNINFYMMFGGTNFGFTNGANLDNDTTYLPQLTSYDYDAPLDEAGDPTPKYAAIQTLFEEVIDYPIFEYLEPSPKGKYGEVFLRPVISVFDYARIPEVKTVVSSDPKTFEELNSYYGYVLYETKITDDILQLANSSALTNTSKSTNASQPVQLLADGVRDRANVHLNRNFVDILSRTENKYTTRLQIYPNATLSLLVENQGRINFGKYMKDYKGLLKNPTINGKPLKSWRMSTLPFKNVTWAESFPTSQKKIDPPAIYVGELVLPPNTKPKDTYVDPTGWGKGVIFVNNFNLGRYWPSRGPQVTLYVPGCYLRPAPEKNFILVFETDNAHPEYKLVFTDKPKLDKLILDKPTTHE